MSLSDTMLQSGCAPHIVAVHGDQIVVLTGIEAGKTFTAVIESVQDFILSGEVSQDRRAHKNMRFTYPSAVPRLSPIDVIKTPDGNKWNAVANPQNGYLSTDFDLIEIVSGKDL